MARVQNVRGRPSQAGPTGKEGKDDTGDLGMEVGPDHVLHGSPDRKPDRQDGGHRPGGPTRPKARSDEQECRRHERAHGQRMEEAEGADVGPDEPLEQGRDDEDRAEVQPEERPSWKLETQRPSWPTFQTICWKKPRS